MAFLMRALTGFVHGKGPDASGAPKNLQELAGRSEEDGGLRRINGDDFDVAKLQGKVVLFVNVASMCGLTPQYKDLVALQKEWEKTYPDKFTIIGTPCDQFLKQEYNDEEKIATFCSRKYNVDFPILQSQKVNGKLRSPLYQFLIGEGDNITWNFEKILVDQDGSIPLDGDGKPIRWSPYTSVTDAKVRETIEKVITGEAFEASPGSKKRMTMPAFPTHLLSDNPVATDNVDNIAVTHLFLHDSAKRDSAIEYDNSSKSLSFQVQKNKEKSEGSDKDKSKEKSDKDNDAVDNSPKEKSDKDNDELDNA